MVESTFPQSGPPADLLTALVRYWHEEITIGDASSPEPIRRGTVRAMARRRYTDDEKQRALELYVTHGPTAVERDLGIAKATVAGWAKRTGARTVRNETMIEAREAIAIDIEAAKASIVAKLMRQADAALDVELAKLENATLHDVVGSRTRAIHDLQLLIGAATERTESSTPADTEVERLRDELAERRAATRPPVPPEAA